MAAAVNSAKPFARDGFGRRALEQPMDDDHVRPGELVTPRNRRSDVRAVVDEQLEVQLRGERARVAVAGRRLVDAAQPPAEREVGRFDGVEEQRAVRPAVLDAQERGVAFEFRETEWGIEPPDDRLEQVSRDRGRVLELALREVRRVPGQVRDDEEAGLR